MTKLLDTVAQFFSQNDWQFDRHDEESTLVAGYQGENGKWPFFAWAREDEHQVVLYSQVPAPIPEGKLLAVAEYITRANYDMIIGSFELNLDDGDCRFKTSIDVADGELTIGMVEEMAGANVVMMDRYLYGLIEVVENDVEPAAAIAEVEAETEPSDDGERLLD